MGGGCGVRVGSSSADDDIVSKRFNTGFQYGNHSSILKRLLEGEDGGVGAAGRGAHSPGIRTWPHSPSCDKGSNIMIIMYRPDTGGDAHPYTAYSIQP